MMSINDILNGKGGTKLNVADGTKINEKKNYTRLQCYVDACVVCDKIKKNGETYGIHTIFRLIDATSGAEITTDSVNFINQYGNGQPVDGKGKLLLSNLSYFAIQAKVLPENEVMALPKLINVSNWKDPNTYQTSETAVALPQYEGILNTFNKNTGKTIGVLIEQTREHQQMCVNGFTLKPTEKDDEEAIWIQNPDAISYQKYVATFFDWETGLSQSEHSVYLEILKAEKEMPKILSRLKDPATTPTEKVELMAKKKAIFGLLKNNVPAYNAEVEESYSKTYLSQCSEIDNLESKIVNRTGDDLFTRKGKLKTGNAFKRDVLKSLKTTLNKNGLDVSMATEDAISWENAPRKKADQITGATSKVVTEDTAEVQSESTDFDFEL